MKFKNKNTGAIIESCLEVVVQMYKNNPRYEEIKEGNSSNNAKSKELTVNKIKEKLTELGIEYPDNANKATLLTYLPQKN